MKVFISWSGEKSKVIAEEFRKWLPSVIQAVEPYFTPQDIAKGTKWKTEIGKELEQSELGFIILTKSNLNAPWLMFEAGALSKNQKTARVFTMLFGVDNTDIIGPLEQFQSANFIKEEFKKVIKEINKQLKDKALDQDVLEKVYDKWWPDLEAKVNEILTSEYEKDNSEERSERDIIEEILGLTRNISSDLEEIRNTNLWSIDLNNAHLFDVGSSRLSNTIRLWDNKDPEIKFLVSEIKKAYNKLITEKETKDRNIIDDNTDDCKS